MIVLGGFFAGSETGIYRLSRFRLRLGIEQKYPFHSLLDKIMDDSGGLVFSMLIGTNLTHYIITSLVTVILLTAAANEHSAQLYATIIIAPILFVFSEVIPKNIYYYRADILMPRLAPVLWFFHKLFTWSGVVGLLKILSYHFSHILGTSAEDPAEIATTEPSMIKQIIRETHDEGFLSSVQNEIMNRLVSISNITARSVMIPANKVRMLDVSTDRSTLLARLEQYHYTRMPVYEHKTSNVIGFINIYEVLCSDREFQSLRCFIKPITRYKASISVIEAIKKMQKHDHKIVLVTSAYSRSPNILGILTMKDLVEEFTGEIAQW